METKKYSIAKDFSRTPGPRYANEGDFSGEVFRTKHFEPLLKKAIEGGYRILVDLDGTHGYGTSFLEETFGGLIRVDKFDYDLIMSHLDLKSDEEEWLVDDIHEYLKQAYEQCAEV